MDQSVRANNLYQAQTCSVPLTETSAQVETNDTKPRKEKESEEDELIDVYRCDYCAALEVSCNKMSRHLVSSRHISASLYAARRLPTKSSRNREIVEAVEIEDAEYEFVLVKEMLALHNPDISSSKSEFMVVCPRCFDTFADIFQCGLHFR